MYIGIHGQVYPINTYITMVISRKHTHVKYFSISTYVYWKSNDALDINANPNLLTQIEANLSSIVHDNIHDFCYNHLMSHYETN